MKSVIALSCLLTVAYALPQVWDKQCPCDVSGGFEYDKCANLGLTDHTVCICPNGDRSGTTKLHGRNSQKYLHPT